MIIYALFAQVIDQDRPGETLAAWWSVQPRADQLQAVIAHGVSLEICEALRKGETILSPESSYDGTEFRLCQVEEAK